MKYYVLNNSLDNTLYYKDQNSDTRLVNESKRFIDRSLAEKFLNNRKLAESYTVKLVAPRKLSESLDKDSVINELESALDDCKEIIGTTLDLIDCYTSDKTIVEEVITDTDVEEIIRKLNKIKSYMAGMSFRPTFDNSLNADIPVGGDS